MMGSWLCVAKVRCVAVICIDDISVGMLRHIRMFGRWDTSQYGKFVCNMTVSLGEIVSAHNSPRLKSLTNQTPSICFLQIPPRSLP
jgi:hypothetical protein